MCGQGGGGLRMSFMEGPLLVSRLVARSTPLLITTTAGESTLVM